MKAMRAWLLLALVSCGSPQPVATVQPFTLPPAGDAGPAVVRPLPEPKRDVLAECTAPGIEGLFTSKAQLRPIPLTPSQAAQVAGKAAFRPLALDPKADDIVYAAML